MRLRATVWAAMVGALGCQFDGSGLDEPSELRVSGTAVDFETGAPVTATATVSTSGLVPPPTVTVTGASFQLEPVPLFSVFHIFAGSAPDYRTTYGVATEVHDRDVTDLEAMVLSEAYVSELTEAFGVEPAPDAGILLGRAVDPSGEGRAGIPARAFQINDAEPATGPFFLDAERRPAPQRDRTSSSGWAVFFDVPTGQVAIDAAPGSGYSMLMAASPSSAAAATLARIVVTDGDPARPQDVSFSGDVVPIFEGRGCDACHSGSGAGRDLGDLTLDASANLIYREISEEMSPSYQVPRIDLQEPEASLLLTMPSSEDPPDAHPNVIFASPEDPDYQTILVWIEEGARDN